MFFFVINTQPMRQKIFVLSSRVELVNQDFIAKFVNIHRFMKSDSTLKGLTRLDWSEFLKACTGPCYVSGNNIPVRDLTLIGPCWGQNLFFWLWRPRWFLEELSRHKLQSDQSIGKPRSSCLDTFIIITKQKLARIGLKWLFL